MISPASSRQYWFSVGDRKNMGFLSHWFIYCRVVASRISAAAENKACAIAAQARPSSTRPLKLMQDNMT
jgi:hypothetical protein